MIFTISGRTYDIKRETILEKARDVIPKSRDGRNRYYVELYGLKYPIKQLIHLATGLSYTGPFGAQDAFRILRKLGFTIQQYHDEKAEPVQTITSNANVVEGPRKFAVTLEQDEDGFILVSCPALPGCHSQGRTDEEAVANIREAIRGYIASMKRHGEHIPAIKEVRQIEVPA